jgi:hypothetical protein
MNRWLGSLLDLALVACVLVYFYFRWFPVDRHPVGVVRGLSYLSLLLTIVAMIVLPFRIKRYPTLAKFATQDFAGRGRKSVVIPALCVFLFVFLTVSAARLLVLLATH